MHLWLPVLILFSSKAEPETKALQAVYLGSGTVGSRCEGARREPWKEEKPITGNEIVCARNHCGKHSSILKDVQKATSVPQRKVDRIFIYWLLSSICRVLLLETANFFLQGLQKCWVSPWHCTGLEAERGKRLLQVICCYSEWGCISSTAEAETGGTKVVWFETPTVWYSFQRVNLTLPSCSHTF